MGEAGADGAAITVIRIAEAEIGADLSRQLQTLLQECFPGYPGRSYFKLPPHFRYLAMTGSGSVVAQMGVEFRVIRVGDTVPASKAAYRLRDVGEVRELLGALAEGATAGSRV